MQKASLIRSSRRQYAWDNASEFWMSVRLSFLELDFLPTRKDCTFRDRPYGSQPRFRRDRRLGRGTALIEPVS